MADKRGDSIILVGNCDRISENGWTNGTDENGWTDRTNADISKVAELIASIHGKLCKQLLGRGGDSNGNSDMHTDEYYKIMSILCGMIFESPFNIIIVVALNGGWNCDEIIIWDALLLELSAFIQCYMMRDVMNIEVEGLNCVDIPVGSMCSDILLIMEMIMAVVGAAKMGNNSIHQNIWNEWVQYKTRAKLIMNNVLCGVENRNSVSLTDMNFLYLDL